MLLHVAQHNIFLRDSCFQGTIQKDQAPQEPYIKHHTARHEQRKDRSNKQQDQADHPESIWLQEHPELCEPYGYTHFYD